MAERNLALRLSVIDGAKLKAELSDIGEKGEKTLKRIEAAARPASEGLKLVDRADRLATETFTAYIFYSASGVHAAKSLQLFKTWDSVLKKYRVYLYALGFLVR